MEKKGKKWYKSKTVWVNIILLGGFLLQNECGINLSGEESASILVIVNLILRIVTGQPLSK